MSTQTSKVKQMQILILHKFLNLQLNKIPKIILIPNSNPILKVKLNFKIFSVKLKVI